MLNRCKSVMGSRHLRYLLRCLPRSLAVIQSRQYAVSYFSHPSQLEVMKIMQDTLKKVKCISRCLKKLTLNQATVRDWKVLKSTLMNMLALAQICHNHTNDDSPDILPTLAFKAIRASDLIIMMSHIDKVFDVEGSEENARFVVKHGVDETLDEKKRVHNGLPELLLQLAQEEVDILPDCMKSCTMVYVPQLGYMLAIDPWPGMPSNEQDARLLEFPDLKFMFFANDIPHFKSKRCVELDETMGDTATNISDHETSIMLALSSYILEKSSLLLELAHLISQLDCLLALASVAKDNDWCRPQINENGMMNIKNGRHPLQEQCVQTFVPNDTEMMSKKVIILTGPNACGKSVYLKQIGIIVYLAHLGCWVPASFATVPLIDAIYTRIQTVDSIAHGLSAFAVDLSQMSLALNNTTKQSLVLVDEFGKGTTDDDGQALLGSSIEYWLDQAEECPYLIVSTHFHSLRQLLEAKKEAIDYLTFMFERHDDELVYLYKCIPGIVTHSEADSVAKKAGIDEKILARSNEILKCITAEGQVLKPKDANAEELAKIIPIIDEFLSVENLDEDRLRKILSTWIS